MFIPGETEGTTRVHTRLYVKLRGLATLVKSAQSIRQMREERVEKQLIHIRDYFRRR